MSSRSLLTRLRQPMTKAAVLVALAIGSLITAVPAQAAPAPDRASIDVPWQVTKAAPADAGTQALCHTPFRYANAAEWNCTVFSSEYIIAYIVCNGMTYYSPAIPEGSWWILGVCPAGTWRDDEGILDY